MAFVYILQSSINGKYYIGSTVNIHRRMNQHNSGHTPSTKKMGLCKLVLVQEYSSIQLARKVEKRIKKLKRKDYIEKMIKDGYIKLEAQGRRSD